MNVCKNAAFWQKVSKRSSYLLVFHLCLAFTVALKWFKSFLSSRSFLVKCDKKYFLIVHFFVRHSLRFCSRSCTFILYTTPLSSLISSLNLNYHLCADDTQLFYSFYSYDSTITHLQNALEHICSWMTANLLTLNSKTEFLLIVNKQTTY